MVNKSLYDLETWAIIDKWFLILHECLSREVSSFYFLPSLSSFCVKKQIEKIILWLKNVCSVLFVCKTRDLAICMYTSDSVIHSTVIWRFASVQGRIKGWVSFCYTDRNDLKNWEMVQGWIFSYIFLEVMHEFCWIFFLWEFFNRWLQNFLAKKSSRHPSRRGWLVGMKINFT